MSSQNLLDEFETKLSDTRITVTQSKMGLMVESDSWEGKTSGVRVIEYTIPTPENRPTENALEVKPIDNGEERLELSPEGARRYVEEELLE
jgi:hypothetical protein